MKKAEQRSAMNLHLSDTHEGPDVDQHIAGLRDEVNARLEEILPEASAEQTDLRSAMRYSLMGPGKRVRPILCVLVSEAAGGTGRSFALDAGCAVEMVHAASLILDDLPCMDAAATRRGQPATYRKFGDASAILASIGLLNRSYEVLAEHEGPSEHVKTAAVRSLTAAVGTDGLVAGQEIDLHERAKYDDVKRVEGLNWLKTGVLFTASAEIGAIAAGLEPDRVDAVKRFSRHVGLAFQTADDLIDQEGTLQSAGKDVGQDEGKPTLVSLVGNDAARQTCHQHLSDARAALAESKLDGAMLSGFVDSVFAHLAKS
ncbi:MAG: polyprenyl synthetase family protein [Pseudomonadota bacterium]